MSAINLAAAAANSLLFATAGSSVMLGDFVFASWEVPEKITWGGAQQIKVHKLAGGTRVIDTMGPDHDPIAWSGIMLGPSASVRADELDQIRIQGQPTTLIFCGRSYTVVVSKCSFTQLKQYHLTYQIECIVQDDGTDDGSFTSPDLIGQMNADLAAAAAIKMSATMANVADQIATSHSLLGPLAGLVLGTAASAGLSEAVGAAAVANNLAEAGAALAIGKLAASGASSGTVIGATTAPAAIAGMGAALVATQTAAASAAVGGYLGRAAMNLAGP